MTLGPNGTDELEGTEQPFVSHLVELRDRLIRAVIAIGICLRRARGLAGARPACTTCSRRRSSRNLPPGATLIATNVISPFVVPLKITLLAAFMLALPVVLYQVWAFVAPGLYMHEKKLVLPLVVSSTLLFLFGVCVLLFLRVRPGVPPSSRASHRRASRPRLTSRNT